MVVQEAWWWAMRVAAESGGGRRGLSEGGSVKFFMLTRGRTGSTAIMDHLLKSPSISATQELFANYKARDREEIKRKTIWGTHLPFDFWIKDAWHRKALSRLGMERCLASKYLADSERQAVRIGAKGFCFKLLSHHFEERPYLTDLLKKGGYKAIYLTRNAPRQVLSGMVAKMRGRFNSIKDYEDETRYFINLEEFQMLVRWELACVEGDIQRLKDDGFEICVVTYEDFLEDKSAFFARIFDFLGLPRDHLGDTDYKVMIKDIAHTIENYNEVAECVESMGLTLKA
ncbi:MAG: sulfotransferase [Nitrosomonadales bacterium]|nr:sulfotransferase [Nitrosomonadales bacterium]